MADDRLIASQDLITAGFLSLADGWAQSRNITSNTLAYRMVDSWGAAQLIQDLEDGQPVLVSWLDNGNHPSVAGDFGSIEGNTPNSGYYIYSEALSTLVRERPLESDISKEWAEGLEPGGPGTKSAKLWTEENIVIAEAVNTKASEVDLTKTQVESIAETVATTAGSVSTTLTQVNTKATEVNEKAIVVTAVRDQTIAAKNETIALSNSTIAATWEEAEELVGLVNNQLVTVLVSDTGSHPSVAGDVGSIDGQTPNGGLYRYSTSLTTLVRYSDSVGQDVKRSADVAIAAAANINNLSFASALIPQLTNFISSPGRIERYGPGLWRKVSANTPRRHISDDGSVVKIIMEGAVPATVKVGPCDVPLGGDNLNQITLVNGAGAVAYADSHTGPDIYGTGGKSVRVTPINTSVIHLPNLITTVVGTIHRVAFFLSVEINNPRQIRVGSRDNAGGATRTALFNCAANGDIVFSANGSSTRGGAMLVDTLVGGFKLYCLWVDSTVASGSSHTPVITFSSVLGSWNDGSSKIYIHSVVSHPDPTALRPVCIPQMVSGPLIGDSVVPPNYLKPTNVHWINEDVSVGVCGDNSGIIEIPSTDLGYNSLPLFERVIMSTGGAKERREFLLPCIQAQAIINESKQKYLGPGWFDITLTKTSAATDDDEFLKSAYTDPLLFARLKKYERTTVGRKFTLENIIGHYRVADSDVAITQNCVKLQNCTEAVVKDVFCMGFHNSAWLAATRGYADAKPGSTVSELFDRGNYGGTLRMERNEINTVTDYAAGNAQNLFTSIVASTLTSSVLNIDGFAGYNSTGDMMFISTGTWDLNLKNAYFGGNTNPMYDTIQMSNEIEVDTGDGWVKLSDSTISPEQLPLGKIFYRYGSWDTDESDELVIEFETNNDRQVMKVDGWVGDKGVSSPKVNRFGFEYQGTRLIDTENDVFYEVPDKTVWISEFSGDLSPYNPRIRLFVEYGSYGAGNVYTPSTSIPTQNTGIHGDAVQFNTTTFMQNMVLENIVCNCALSQGLFFTPRGGGVDTIDAKRIIVAAGQGNGITLNSTKTGLTGIKTFSDTIILTVEDGHRFAPGGSGVTSRFRSEGVSGGYYLGPNVWANTDSVLSSGSLILPGGFISGTINKFGVSRITDFITYTEPSVDQPELITIENVIDTAYSKLTKSYRLPPLGTPEQLVFRQSFCDLSNVDWNDIVKQSTRTYYKFLPCLEAFHFTVKPGRLYSVPTSASVGTVIASGFAGAVITEGDMYRYFKIVGDDIVVAKALPVVTTARRAFGLEFDRVDNILIQVTA